MNTTAIDIEGLLDKYMSPVVRKNIEKNYYEKINAQAQIHEVMKDPDFLKYPLKHATFFTDHGVAHIRDIASRILVLTQQLNGIHFAKRPASRLEFMKGLGVLMVYVHDIGMIDVRSVERDMHAQIGVQMIFSDFFDQQLSILWEENSGNLAWRITRLVNKEILTQVPKNIFREMLSFSSTHTKTIASVATFNQPETLRPLLQAIIAYPIEYQWLRTQLAILEKRLESAQYLPLAQRELYQQQKQQSENALAQFESTNNSILNDHIHLYYRDFWQESFQWLLCEHPEVKEFVQDIIDTMRLLRCANASRQRGVSLRSTGGHQIFLDHHDGSVVYAVNAQEKLFLVQSKETILSGEVNLSSTEFTQSGDLRISFYRGHFLEASANTQAIFNAAVAIHHLQEDMIGIFKGNHQGDYQKKFQPVYILLENCEDNLDFSSQVKEQLLLLNPTLKETIKVVPSLKNAPEQEKNRYLNATELKWDLNTQQQMLDKIAHSGHKTISMRAQEAFSHVKCANIHAGEVLMQVGTTGYFVYIPLDEGLIGYPLGGYAPFHNNAYVPLGNIGVIRGDVRNATVIAEKALQTLMIPKEIYLQYWHKTYTEQEFIQCLSLMPTKH